MIYNEFDNDPSKIFLGAINTMLSTIGEADIEDESDIENVLEASKARNDLIQVKKEVLASEWDINTDDTYSLVPDNNGYIPIPSNILRISSTDSNLIVREHFLYSKSSQSIRFDTPQTVKVVWDIPFNDIPFTLRNYITLLACKRFRDRTLGADSTHHSFTAEDVRDAYIEARRAEADSSNANMLSVDFNIERN